MSNRHDYLVPVMLRLAGTLLVLFAPFIVHAQSEPDRKAAQRAVLDLVRARETDGLPCGPAIRAHMYNEVLESKTQVRPYLSDEKESEPMVCAGTCLMFFVDWCPTAHYEHPVTIVLWDEDPDDFGSAELDWLDAQWWPVIVIPGEGDLIAEFIPAFHTVAQRSHPHEVAVMEPRAREAHHGTIIEDSASVLTAGSPSRVLEVEPLTPSSGAPSANPGASEVRDPNGAKKQHVAYPSGIQPSISVWAVVVNGSEDIDDTFDEDTDGMYAVLRGHQVPEDQIYYLSPHFPLQEPGMDLTTQLAADPLCPDVDPSTPSGPHDYLQRTSLCSLKNILVKHIPERIQNGGSTCTELLFFYSSHGTANQLRCVHMKNYGGYVQSDVLSEWLARVPCQKVTVVIEACKSGSFIEALSSPPVLTPPAPYPQQERIIFTSTTATGASHADIDENDTNPGDAGSETIWGYIEAFGAGSADLPDQGTFQRDGRISFAEAITYARKHDASIRDPRYYNNPQVYPNPPGNHFPHSSYPETFSLDFFVASAQTLQPEIFRSAALIRPVTIDREQPLHLVVTNGGPSIIDVATVRIFWGEVSDEISPGFSIESFDQFGRPLRASSDAFWWPTGFKQIGDTVLLTNLAPGHSRSFRLRWRNHVSTSANDTLVLLATVDGPKDPLTVQRIPVLKLVNTDNNSAAVIANE